MNFCHEWTPAINLILRGMLTLILAWDVIAHEIVWDDAVMLID